MAMTWTPERAKLFYAVYHAITKTSKYAPATSIGAGCHLRRAMDARYLSFTSKGGKRMAEPASVLGAITVRDATKDGNRFTGIAPMLPGMATPPVQRGGLYTSEEHTALLAELYHYADKSLPTDPWGKAAPASLVTPKCFIKMKLVREATLADLDDSTSSTVGYFGDIEKDAAVAAALKTLGYKSLHEAVWHPADYAAGRALGLGFAANAGFDGMRITSARGFDNADVVGETGNNVVLFAEDMKPACGIVLVTSLHLVQQDPSGQLTATHFLLDPAGDLVEASTTKVP